MSFCSFNHKLKRMAGHQQRNLPALMDFIDSVTKAQEYNLKETIGGTGPWTFVKKTMQKKYGVKFQEWQKKSKEAQDRALMKFCKLSKSNDKNHDVGRTAKKPGQSKGATSERARPRRRFF